MKRILRNLVLVNLLICIMASYALAGNTRSMFDGYPSESTIMLEMVVDYGARTDGQPLYIGYRMPGVSESSVGWLIFKCIYDVSDNFLRKVSAGSENQFDKVWDNRASYTYDES